MKRKNKKKSLFDIISIIVTLLCLFALTLFSYFIFKINIVPTKYLVVGYGLFILIIILLLFGVFGKSKKFIKLISLIIMLVLSFGFGYASYYLNNTYHFLSSTQSNYDTLTYSVVVLKDSSYQDINFHAMNNLITINYKGIDLTYEIVKVTDNYDDLGKFLYIQTCDEFAQGNIILVAKKV